ncbi:MAG: metallophosphoesterase [Pseudotabrizicola sp.]|uniref:metallophosphoesterase n=1 Tax=Pseudotabrizicola sp. TaxID=2939647 RepID=UPI002716F70E|nr:metallophosphoesterase [Pseudotabrizicola sp.]MDO9640834.1 metallophosphoesterase [Pseudotabrizicola sp.]
MSPIVVPYVTGRLIILADLHMDHYPRSNRDPFAAHGLDQVDWSGIDALIVAGDLANNPTQTWPDVFRFLRRYIPSDRTYVFPGNHDFYRHSLDREAELLEMTNAAGATYVQKRVLHHESTRVLCCTLWTDFALGGDTRKAMQEARALMNDFRLIASKWSFDPSSTVPGLARPRAVTPADILTLHLDHREWLDAVLSEPTAAGHHRTVVVTHHGPHPATAGSQDTLTAAFHSDLSDMIARHQPDYWFFGHSHRRLAAIVGKTDIRNISMGYPGEARFPGDHPLRDLCILDADDDRSTK